jgi:hypothetical protein
LLVVVVRALDTTHSEERGCKPAALAGRMEVVDFSLTEGDELRGVLLPLWSEDCDAESERSMAL